MPGRTGLDERNDAMNATASTKASTRMLIVYHPGSGASMSLTDPVYLVDYMSLTEAQRQAVDEGKALLGEDLAGKMIARLTNWEASEYFDQVSKQPS